MIEQVGLRICTKCMEPRVRFYKNKHRPDGLDVWCVECRTSYNEIYRARIEIPIKVQNPEIAGHAYCCSCKQLKSMSEFHKNKSRKGGYALQCKTCSKRYVHTGYKKNIRYIATKKEIILEFGGGCCRCGYNEFLSALGFHHVNPTEKEYSPGDIIRKGNIERSFAEINKCVLLCTNCHSSLESGEWNGEFIKRNGLGYLLKV